jgi:hypothetical protein
VHIPPQDKSRCDKCRAPVVMCETAAKSKGHPVVIAVDAVPTTAGLTLHKQVIVSIVRGKYFAGGFTTRAKRDAAASAGVELHMPHRVTCNPAHDRWTKR